MCQKEVTVFLVIEQVEVAIEEADAILFVVDVEVVITLVMSLFIIRAKEVRLMIPCVSALTKKGLLLI